jgi:hypothetical protein
MTVYIQVGCSLSFSPRKNGKTLVLAGIEEAQTLYMIRVDKLLGLAQKQ